MYLIIILILLKLPDILNFTMQSHFITCYAIWCNPAHRIDRWDTKGVSSSNHGYCVRNICGNVRGLFKDGEIVKLFTKAAYAISTYEFEKNMAEPKSLNEDAFIHIDRGKEKIPFVIEINQKKASGIICEQLLVMIG